MVGWWTSFFSLARPPERLFAVFDKKAIGEIDYEEFITGLAVTCRGSWDEKIAFIFNIYDVHGTGTVGREELAALLNHVPRSVMRFGKAMALEHNSMHSAMHGGGGVSQYGSMQHLAALDHASMHSHRSAQSLAAAVTDHSHHALNGSTAGNRKRSSTVGPGGAPSAVPSAAGLSGGGGGGNGIVASASVGASLAVAGGGVVRRSLSPDKRSSSDSDLSPDPAADVGGPSGHSGGGGEPADARSFGYRNHFETFTNNDIVEQALEECDLNKDGKLSLNEFRLWVERNPVVSQFLSSVFPYDEHRDWGNDKKHLPFIHNRDVTGSPPYSAPGSADGDGERRGVHDDEAEVRRLLLRARELTHVEEVRDGVAQLVQLLERRQAAAASGGAGGGGLPGVPEASMEGGSGAASVAGNSVGGLPPGTDQGYALNGGMGGGGGGGGGGGMAGMGGGLAPPGSILRVPSVMSLGGGGSAMGGMGGVPMSPRSARALHHQDISKMGVLWKLGHRTRRWKQRWFVLVGNCVYYYHYKNDRYPRGVVFMTGSFVEPLRDEELEKRSYWGMEITRNNEQLHRRRLFARSKVERDKWVHELRRASEVIPIEEDFEIGDELGKGRFSRVCMCVNKHTLERKAVKIIEKDSMDPEEKELLRQEIAIMKLVNHPNIIRMEAVYESRQFIYIVMELHSGGELFDRIVGRPRFSEDECFTIIYPLAESVAYLHEMGIVHRDLKPENILCGEHIGDIKIADFGLSKIVLPDEIMKMPCGTLSYVAPEVLTLNGYSKEADIWSVGVIMYLLLRGRLPFDGDTREDIIENTIHGSINIQEDEVWQTYSAEVRSLVLGMLTKDTKRRYTAKQILADHWITSRIEKMGVDPAAFDYNS
ncbi:unnamed protein product [Phaeothamnion confervicola]